MEPKITTSPRVGHDQFDKPYPFLITCNGNPFAGFPTREQVEAALKLYSSWEGRKGGKDSKIADFAIKVIA